MDDILSLLQDFDVSNFLPGPNKFMNSLESWARLLVLAGPLVLLCMGLWRYCTPPKKPSERISWFRYWGFGSKEAWWYARRLSIVAYQFLGGSLTVLMFIISLFFNGEKAMDMMTAAMLCIALEILALLGVWVYIYIQVKKTFSKKPRRKK